MMAARDYSLPLTTRQKWLVTRFFDRVPDPVAYLSKAMHARHGPSGATIVMKAVRCGVTVEDIRAECEIGLVTASRTFDWRRGQDGSIHTAFRTHCCMWMIRKIQQAIKVKARHEQRYKTMSVINGQTDRQDYQMSDGGPAVEAIDVLVQDSVDELIESQWLGTLRARVALAVRKLPARERQVIEFRFGLNGRDKRTLNEVGTIIGLTRERVRQIEMHAREMIRPWLAPVYQETRNV